MVRVPLSPSTPRCTSRLTTLTGAVGSVVDLGRGRKRKDNNPKTNYFSRYGPTKSFQGKTVVITGASSGIGKALALRYAQLGSKMVLAARRRDLLDDVVKACISQGTDAIAVTVDVTKEDDCKKLIEEALAKFGSIDLLVIVSSDRNVLTPSQILNAGRGTLMPLRHVKPFELDFMKSLTEINYYGCIYPTVQALPHIRSSKGNIAVISSLSAKVPSEGRAFYAATKAAINSFYSCLRVEEPDITVTLINPGFVSTEINDHSFKPKGFKRHMEESSKMTAARCAELCEGYISRGVIDEVMTPLGKFGYFMAYFFPGLVDIISRQKSKQISALIPE
ncbi:short-chain dehydrogenase/reductase [Planoprotostelium fungivorum]|uniref:Short-chain dehydrogenase/reductase n=1 Tax=Planoprotostelium fungivorum TaxID=1890364 RepID=A0A2P6N8Z9_9EUKA|nr:short-chain dehydrogenase/reductase [Planoprotostelium fungivorum]